MKVFLSWSGEPSKSLAYVFGKWLPLLFHTLDVFYSPDIDKGQRWSQEITSNLEMCDIGIIFLTQENLQRPWILYEAGALSKKARESRAMTFLFEVKSIDVKEPLSQFQHTVFSLCH